MDGRGQEHGFRNYKRGLWDMGSWFHKWVKHHFDITELSWGSTKKTQNHILENIKGYRKHAASSLSFHGSSVQACQTTYSEMPHAYCHQRVSCRHYTKSDATSPGLLAKPHKEWAPSSFVDKFLTNLGEGAKRCLSCMWISVGSPLPPNTLLRRTDLFIATYGFCWHVCGCECVPKAPNWEPLRDLTTLHLSTNS